MIEETIEAWNVRCEGLSPREILSEVFGRYGSGVVMAWGGGREGMVQLDIALKLNPSLRVFILDTEKLPPETYQLIAVCERKYGIRIERRYPDEGRLDKMVMAHGMELYRKSVDLRKLCCRVRKGEPLQRKLFGFQAWITALTRFQSQGRGDTQIISIDDAHGGIVKICPLSTWRPEQIKEYIASNGVPYNRLHDRGFESIGCDPCTRPDHPDDGVRGNRWWWEPVNFEDGNAKECGIHIHEPFISITT